MHRQARKISRFFLIVFLIPTLTLGNFLFLPIKTAKAASEFANCHSPLFIVDGWQLQTQTLIKANSPYCLRGRMELSADETLTIEAGTVIKFEDAFLQSGVMRGSHLDLFGRLDIKGTAQEPVIFTSIRDDEYAGDTNEDGTATSPTKGDWDIINLYGLAEKKIDYAIFKYGGGHDASRMLHAGMSPDVGPDVSITHSVITESATDGIGVDKNFVKFESNKIYDNDGLGVKDWSADADIFIDVRNNWWGSDDGPNIWGVHENFEPGVETIGGHFYNNPPYYNPANHYLYEPWLKLSDLEYVPAWRENIQPGDILYDRFASGVGHAGLYVGDNKVIEAVGYPFWTSDYPGKVEKRDIVSWDYPQRNTVYLLRVKKPDYLNAYEWQQRISSAIDFAKKQQSPTAKSYDWSWHTKQYDINSPSWYCSELVWAAYFNQGVDLEYKSSNTPIISLGVLPIIINVSPVSPVEIFNDEDTEIIGSHLEGEGSVPWYHKFAPLLVMSPVNVIITDKDGNVLDQNSNNIPGATFIEDQVDENGHKYSIIYLPVEQGPYQIKVVRKPDANDGDTYSLKLETEDGDEWLAQDEPVPTAGESDEYEVILNSDSDTGSGQGPGAFVSGFSDTEESSANTYQAGTLDLSATTTPVENLIFGSPAEGGLIFNNVGSLDFNYQTNFDSTAGNQNLCDNLQVEAKDAADVTLYTGYINSFALSASLLSASATADIKMTFSLVADGDVLKNQTCELNLKSQAWQDNLADGSSGFSDEENLTILITTGDWGATPPAIPVCGNGAIEIGETCDDSNTTDGDGCSATCAIEPIAMCVKINEVYYDPNVGSANNEWIELYNACSITVNLQNWTLQDKNGTETITQSYPIGPGDFVVIAADVSTWNNWPNIPNNAFKIDMGGSKLFNGLTNSGDHVFLLDDVNHQIDAVSWGADTVAFNPSVPVVASGHSISRKVKGVDTDTAADWMDTHSGSTPSGPNPGTNPHTPDGQLSQPLAEDNVSDFDINLDTNVAAQDNTEEENTEVIASDEEEVIAPFEENNNLPEQILEPADKQEEIIEPIIAEAEPEIIIVQELVAPEPSVSEPAPAVEQPAPVSEPIITE